MERIPVRASFQWAGEDWGLAAAWHLRCAEARGLSPHSLRHYREALDRFLPFAEARQLRPCDVTAQEIREFLLGLGALSGATRNRYLRGLKAFFNALVKEGFLPANPAVGLAMVRELRRVLPVLSSSQVQALLRAIPASTWKGRRDYALCVLLLDCGARISEALGANQRDLDWAEATLLVMGKGGKERRVPFGNLARRSLAKWLAVRGEIPGQEALFVNRCGQRLGREGAQRLIAGYGQKAGIQGVRVSPHTFRYTFATMWLRNGGDLFTLQRILGHSSLEMVRRYAQQVASDLQEKHRLFSPMDRLTR
jgi:integrase/recombinase XerD